MLTYLSHCDNCNRDVIPLKAKLRKVFDVKGTPIKATINILVCPYCNYEIYDEDNEKENEKIVYNLYKEKTGIDLLKKE